MSTTNHPGRRTRAFLIDEMERLITEMPRTFSALMHQVKGERDNLAKELDALKAELDALRSIGGKLANVAYNLAQRGGQTLSTHDAEILDKLRREWDAARKVTP